ncbi:hypothetical protein HUU05_28970 [candidate division KSB1 bacterium]|nr:hypothetical protein [candidate division KSB1 bacterium]
MNLKTNLLNGLKILALTFIMFILFAIAAGVVGMDSATAQAQTQTEQASGALSLLFACLLNTLVLSYLIVRSRWSGWKLMATIFIVFYGVMTVMSQIESAVFITKLPSGMLPKLFVMGLLIAAPFAIFAVLIWGKRKAESFEGQNPRLLMPAREWAWKLGVLVLAYVVLYFTFGYFIAWQNPAVREYYGGAEAEGFFAHMAGVFRTQTWLVFFQMLRGLMWIGLALPVIRMMKGAWWEAALAVALLFAVVMNAQLLLPNPYMPETVRMTHLLETATSNFVFGGLVAWLLSHKSPHTERMKNAIQLHA